MARRVSPPKRATHTPEGFLKALAPHLIAELRPPGVLAQFTRNPDVVGAYVEAAVRQMISRYVAPLRVSTGAVIDQENEPFAKDLPQVDTIIWSPSPAPAVFQAGEFALVPRSSSFGVLEIKSSAYRVRDLDPRLDPTFVRGLVADSSREEVSTVGRGPWGMGVVCVRTATQSQKTIDNMRNASRVAVLFEQKGDQVEAQPEGIYALMNFLSALRFRARCHEGRVGINLALLGMKPGRNG